MTIRERVLTSLQHRQPDKIPYHVGFTYHAYRKMAEYYGDSDFPSKIGNCFWVVDCHQRNAWREVSPGHMEDHFGVIWDRTVDKDIGVVTNRAITPENVETYPFPDPASRDIWEPLESAAAEKGDMFLIAQVGFSLFERAWTLAGMEQVLMGMAGEPDFVNRLLDRIVEYNLRIIERACSYDIDAMMFGDDWGSQRGLITGPAFWCEYILPRARRMYQAVRQRGKHVLIHSCGRVDELFPHLIEAGVDVFNPFQPEVIDVYEAKRKYGSRLSFYGGISTQHTLPYGTPQETREEVKRLLEVVGENGGYVAAPAHDVPADAKPENIAAMLEVLQSQ